MHMFYTHCSWNVSCYSRASCSAGEIVPRVSQLNYRVLILNMRFVSNPKLSNWNVSNVRNMDRVFDHAYSFNKDISSWDVSSVTSMNYMFTKQNRSIEIWMHGIRRE